MRIFGNLRTKIILLYLVLAVIPIVLVSLISSTIYSNVANRIEDSLLDYAAAQAAENLAVEMASLHKIMAQIVTSQDIISLYDDFEDADLGSSESATTRNRILNQFSYFSQMDNYITSIVFISNRLEVAAYDRYEANYTYNTRWSNQELRKAFLALGKTPSYYQIGVVPTVNFTGAPSNADEHVYFTFPAIDFISRRSYGTIVMEVRSNAFNVILDLRGSDSGRDIFISPTSCVTNSEGIILASPDQGLVGKRFSSLDSAGEEGFTSKSLPINGTDFALNLVFDSSALRRNTGQLGNLVFLATMVITGTFVFIVILVTGRLQRRSSRIAAAIARFRENQQDVDVVVDERDEIFYVIADQFNQMTSEITTLVSELRAKNEHVAAATDQRRRAEIRALQAQINPHFLYNALDRINWMAIDNDQSEISEMLAGLASLLRYSISNIDILVPLRAEIQWMEKYLLIQGKRFDQKYELDCSVYGDAIDFPIYKMLLQPLVENSILHGFASRSEGNRIRLDARIREDARLRLVLSDNGNGMSEEMLAAIRQVIAIRRSDSKENSPTAESGSNDLTAGFQEGIGIHNVTDRLWLYYGDEGDIQVDSALGKGAIFTLTIPYREHG